MLAGPSIGRNSRPTSWRIKGVGESRRLLRVCSYEDRAEAMDSLILMGESLCAADKGVSLHLTVPDAPASVRAWAQRRPEVILSTMWPRGVSGWDVKPWLMLQQLDEGVPETVWLDDDIIVTKPISKMLLEFPRESLIFTEEWGRWTVPVSHLWGTAAARPVLLFNNCLIRATQAHRPLLERWLEMTRDARYREAQALPFERRPRHLQHDGWLLIAILESQEFGQVAFDSIRRGRHIAQCAGSSGYRPRDRVLDLFRGLPPLIHGLGRKPWEPGRERSRAQRFLLDLATDVSAYVLAAQRVAKGAGVSPAWLEPRTRLGALFRRLTAGHPGLAGLPLASVHALHTSILQRIEKAPGDQS
jgi:hypothetical protein